MRNITVLVTGVGSTPALSVIKGFQQQSEFHVQVVGTDTHSANMIAGSHFCNGFYTVPPATDPNYVPEMLEICVKEQIQLLIPIIDPELLVLAESKDRFAKIGVQVVVSDPHCIRICNDKWATYQFLKQQGIPMPDTWVADEVSAPENLPYPVFVKPRDGMSSVNAFRVDSAEEFRWANKRIENLVVQSYLVGEEYTTDILADMDGHLVAVVPRLRLQTKAGIIYKGRTCQDERLIYWGRRISEALTIKGPANAQCIVSGDGVYYFEVNPRFSAGLPLTIAAGVNAPWWLLRLVLGEKAPESLLPFKPITMTRYWSEVFHPDKQERLET